MAADTVGLVKPQAAFYERHGWRGIRTLSRLIDEAHSAGLLVVLDAKRGDVGSTNRAYAEAYLGADAPMGADALTVHPYLGVAAMGSLVQAACDEAGRSVEQMLLDNIRELNAELAPGAIGPVGAVIGPTHIDPRLDLIAPNALYLAPGVGRQGASPDDVAEVFRACPERVFPSASRSLLTSADPGRLRNDVAAMATEFVDLLGR